MPWLLNFLRHGKQNIELLSDSDAVVIGLLKAWACTCDVLREPLCNGGCSLLDFPTMLGKLKIG